MPCFANREHEVVRCYGSIPVIPEKHCPAGGIRVKALVVVAVGVALLLVMMKFS